MNHIRALLACRAADRRRGVNLRSLVTTAKLRITTLYMFCEPQDGVVIAHMNYARLSRVLSC